MTDDDSSRPQPGLLLRISTGDDVARCTRQQALDLFHADLAPDGQAWTDDEAHDLLWLPDDGSDSLHAHEERTGPAVVTEPAAHQWPPLQRLAARSAAA